MPNSVVSQKAVHFDIQGHRGCRGYVPENTIQSCIAGVKMGASTIEIDVVISKDSQVVVSHEPFFHHYISTHPNGIDITRENETSFNLFKMTVAEIQSFDVGRKQHPHFPLQKPEAAIKPTLKQLVLAVNEYVEKQGLAPVKFNIELKRNPANDNLTHPEPNLFARLVYNASKDLGILTKCNFQSFDPEILRLLHVMDGELILAFLVDNNATLTQNLDDLGFLPSIFSPHYKKVTQSLVTECQAQGMKIIPWTVNEESDMLRLIDMGVDGIISDYPDKVNQQYQFSLKK